MPKFLIIGVLAAFGVVVSAGDSPSGSPTFYRDVLPVLQAHCQECHRPGEIAPMPFLTYDEVRPWAKSIRNQVLTRRMPPWFADPCCGKFANDRSLGASERDALIAWVDKGSPAGDPKQAPPPRVWPQGWNLPSAPDAVLEMREPFAVPARQTLDYQYFILPTGFTEDRWISAIECKPSSPSVVHHVVVYIREPGQTWTHGPVQADILTVYTPGASPEVMPKGMAKLVKAGSDLVIETHYTPNGTATTDRTRVALVFAKAPPARRVLTLQMANTKFVIPPGDPDYRVIARGKLPHDALIIGFFPHMHLRGKAFEYVRDTPFGPVTMLKVPAYDFYWQLSYRLAEPLPLEKGTPLEWIAWYDNSANNPRNPDPTASVRYGLQSWQEMMIGFIDVAVDPTVGRNEFFADPP